jgi:hypothetical protein
MPPVAWPLKVSANGRHLVDQQKRPFLVVADTAWMLFAGADRAAAEYYLDDRRSLGVNTIVSLFLPFSNSVVYRKDRLKGDRLPCGVEAFADRSQRDLRQLKSKGTIQADTLVREDHLRLPVKPVFNMEPTYEHNRISAPKGYPGKRAYVNAFAVRRHVGWSFLSGAMGVAYSHAYVYSLDFDHSFGEGKLSAGQWRQHLGDPGLRNIVRLAALFRDAAWWKLEPDFAHRLVVAGFGTDGGIDYATVAMATAGSVAFGYFPTGRKVTVDFDVFRRGPGKVEAVWFDTTNAAVSSASTPDAARDCVQLAMPAANAADDGDFVLWLRRAP